MSNRQAKPILRWKDYLHVANWNVGTLQDVDVQAQTLRELWKYSVHIAFLSEVRIRDSGLPVAIALIEAAQATLLAFARISTRLYNARLMGTMCNYTAVTVYAPTLDKAKEAMDLIYEKLRNAVHSVPAGDLLNLTGHWNARPVLNHYNSIGTDPIYKISFLHIRGQIILKGHTTLQTLTIACARCVKYAYLFISGRTG